MKNVNEEREFGNQDNNYNCPIVQSYSEAIRLNEEELEKNNITYINPFLPLDEKKLLKRLLEVEEFKKYNFTKKELRSAIHEGFLELAHFKDDVRKKGEEIIRYIDKHNEKAIVLAGRPYHLDKEVNHGIDTMINSLFFRISCSNRRLCLSFIKIRVQLKSS